MIFLMTKDSFLLQGFWQLKDNHEMIKINSLSEIKKVGNKPFKVIILFILSAVKKVSKIFLRLLMVNTCPIRIHNYVFHIISSKLCN